MPYEDFEVSYRRILRRSVGRLRDDRFAVLVVGDFRDQKTGDFRHLVGLTIDAMEAAGAAYHDEGPHVNPCGTAPLRARQQWEKSRKLVKTHEQVLVFVRGDPRKATEAIRAARTRSAA